MVKEVEKEKGKEKGKENDKCAIKAKSDLQEEVGEGGHRKRGP